MKRAVGLAVGTMALALAGCSGGGGGGGTDTGESANSAMSGGCATETRAEPFSAGMSKTGDNGVKVAIMQSDPAPPQIYDNVWELQVSDASGMLEGATLEIEPRMPDHGHGSPRVPQITDMGGGDYEAKRVNFNMSGYWEVHVRVKTADMKDEVMFPICIE